MITGMETGIGPALRVLRHFIERRRFYQLKFASGEQALVLIAGMPAPSVELVRLILGGVVPWQTVWQYNPIRAGGYSDYIHKLTAMFSPTKERSDDSDHYIRDALLPCRSLEEAHSRLLERKRRANALQPKLRSTSRNISRDQSPMMMIGSLALIPHRVCRRPRERRFQRSRIAIESEAMLRQRCSRARKRPRSWFAPNAA